MKSEKDKIKSPNANGEFRKIEGPIHGEMDSRNCFIVPPLPKAPVQEADIKASKKKQR